MFRRRNHLAMKRTCALLLSIVLLMAQFTFAAPGCGADATPTVSAAKHSCCAPAKLACNAACCVVREAAPRDTSVPVPVTDHGPRLTPLVLFFALWTLPAPAELPASVSASSSDAASAPAVPLFLRHGALLI